MTADPPRLGRGEHFDLARAVLRKLEERFPFGDRLSLINFFGIPTSEQDWLDDLLNGDQEALIQVANYLGVPVPDDEEADSELPRATAIDTYAELVAAETAFREIVRSAIGKSWVDDLSVEKVDALREKRDAEDRRRDGVSVSQDLLDYTEAYQLESLILKHWEKTGPILKDKKRTEVYLNLMLDVRNTVAHARPVAPFERHILAGVAGQLQNLISRYRSESETADSYYASINSIRDSFGDEATDSAYGQMARHRLKVGQTVTFECSATDPYDRGIEWSFSVGGPSSGSTHFNLGTAVGDEVTIEWTVEPEHFGEGRYVSVSIANASPYKRHGSWDDSAYFVYNISPPVPPRIA